MKNKKAWLRIVEAVIAVLIVFTAVLYIYSKNELGPNDSENFYQKQRDILRYIAGNFPMRVEILSIKGPLNSAYLISKTSEPLVYNFVESNIPKSWGFAIAVCKIDLMCNLDAALVPTNVNVYSSETIISAEYDKYPDFTPRKIRLFLWRKNNT